MRQFEMRVVEAADRSPSAFENRLTLSTSNSNEPAATSMPAVLFKLKNELDTIARQLVEEENPLSPRSPRTPSIMTMIAPPTAVFEARTAAPVLSLMTVFLIFRFWLPATEVVRFAEMPWLEVPLPLKP